MPDAPPTIPAALARVVEECPDRDAIVTLDDRITWRELDEASRNIAADLGVRPGVRVGLLMPNGVDWAVIAFAVWRAGGVLVPLSTLLRPPELEQQLALAGVERLVLVNGFRGRDYRAEFAALLAPMDTCWWRSQSADVGAGRLGATPDDTDDPVPIRPTDDLAIIFTSGSAGPPKGVIHTHGSALWAVASGLDVRTVRPGERLYVPMPFFWVGGLSTGLLTALVGRATLLTEAESVPEQTLELLTREKVTLFRGWPHQAATLAAAPGFAAADLSTLRPGSLQAVLPPELRAPPGARAIFGMTETFGPYCGDPLDTDMPPEAWGSCGTPFSGVEVRIVDDEIWLRGPNLLRGICGRRDVDVFTTHGWYRTGDAGHIGGDGRLWYHGRLDEALKIKGVTVYPTEVEAAILALPDVARAFVIGVPDQGGRIVLGAVVIPREGVLIDDSDVRAMLKTRVSAFKIPERISVLAPGAEVRHTPSGKVEKAALRNLLSTHL